MPPPPPPPVRPPPRREAAPQPVHGRGAPAGASPLQAFLAGAGVDANAVSEAEAAELMHQVGVVFRETVQGLLDVLAVRSSLRDNMRVADRTTIRPRNNNPLKHSATLESAIDALLLHPHPGFLPADRAVRDSFRDIKAHELAVMAGMQVALHALLRRFDPDQLEKRIQQHSLWDSILPANRKAKYWELFRDLYQQIAREAEDDFHGLFGREFSRAYEEQAKKL